jgi:ATP-dependent RNA helicase DDX23/PRP28
MTDSDLTAIRSRYLGVDKKKRKIRKMNDRKFVFDWDEQEDTFTPEMAGPVANLGQGTGVMFGRGHLAGMDDGGGDVRRGGDEKLADAMERRKAARNGVDERHWSEKPLSEMKERDWRIFREDFSIAARGSCISITYLMHSKESATQAVKFHPRYDLGASLAFRSKYWRL